MHTGLRFKTITFLLVLLLQLLFLLPLLLKLLFLAFTLLPTTSSSSFQVFPVTSCRNINRKLSAFPHAS